MTIELKNCSLEKRRSLINARINSVLAERWNIIKKQYDGKYQNEQAYLSSKTDQPERDLLIVRGKQLAENPESNACIENFNRIFDYFLAPSQQQYTHSHERYFKEYRDYCLSVWRSSQNSR